MGLRIGREHRRCAYVGRRRRRHEGLLADLVLGHWRLRIPPRRQDAGVAVPDRQLADQRQVAHRNPFEAGPAGGAGLERCMRPTTAGKSPRARPIAATASGSRPTIATPSGIGENSFIPLFLRVTRKLTKDARIDFYGGDRDLRQASRRLPRMAAAAITTTTTSAPRSARRSSLISEMSAASRRLADRSTSRSCGCAIRYDHTGVSRIGRLPVGTWATRLASTGIWTGRGARTPGCPRQEHRESLPRSSPRARRHRPKRGAERNRAGAVFRDIRR